MTGQCLNKLKDEAMKILTVIGARPQFIKAAPVSRAIAAEKGLQEVVVHTGQHFDENMSQVFFHQMKLPRPTHMLDIHSLPHGAMTGRMTEAIEGILMREAPDWLMVYGDTNSTLAGALAASKLHIPIAHVEAGLRSFNMQMPEEVNRILTDRLSSLLFCPTPVAMDNLRQEGFERFPARMRLTGDVMYDASLMFRDKAVCPDGLKLDDPFILSTIHRAENTDDPRRLGSLITALNALSEEMSVVFPMHPRTRKILEKSQLPPLAPGVQVTGPLGYLEILYLLQRCALVVTDSGGMQKEAYFFRKPCLTLREETEWTELVKAGYNRVCGSDTKIILRSFRHFMEQEPAFSDGLYGKGNASAMIAKAFLDASG